MTKKKTHFFKKKTPEKKPSSFLSSVMVDDVLMVAKPITPKPVRYPMSTYVCVFVCVRV